MNLAPITLFTYNRPWHTRQTVEALQKNELAKQSDLIIFSDAPKNSLVEESVQEVRDYLHTVDGFKSIKVIERTENWGLAKSIITGVTEVVNQYGKVIVLEDDLVTSPYFLRFMNDALIKYESEKRVFGVTGYAYPIKKDNLSSAFFMKDEGCWGWATWQDNWRFFEKNVDDLIANFSKKMIKAFNFDNSNNFWAQIVLNQKGKIDTWAVFWYASIFKQNGLFLHPRDSFVTNIGHDGSGVHCDESNFFNTELVCSYQIDFPDEITVCLKAREAHKDYFKAERSILRRIFFKVKRILHD